MFILKLFKLFWKGQAFGAAVKASFLIVSSPWKSCFIPDAASQQLPANACPQVYGSLQAFQSQVTLCASGLTFCQPVVLRDLRNKPAGGSLLVLICVSLLFSLNENKL